MMTKNEAIDEAISSLNFEADDTYQESEIDDEIAEWQKKKHDAATLLEQLKD